MNINLFSPHNGQKYIIDNFADSKHKFGVVATGRQFGKSLLAQNMMLYWLLKSPNQKGVWITPIYNQCKKIFQELTNAANPLITAQNKADLTITFINGSTIQFLSTNNYNTIRGFSFHYMVIDEAAFIREEAINEAVLPTLTALGKKCLIISTPKSKNWFYHYFLRGNVSSDVYISFKGVSRDNPYVNRNFLIEQQKSLPKDIYNQEYLAEFTDAGQDVFTGVEDVCILNQWNGPRKGTRYYVGIDFGLANDYSVLTVIDEHGRVSRVERTNGSSYSEIAGSFSDIIRQFSIAGGYAEINGVGRPVFEMLHTKERKLKPFVTSNDTKNTGIRKLIYDIQQQQVELPSKELFPHLFHELSAYTYKINPSGLISFGAPNGIHDDCVMSLMLANQARTELGSATGKIYIGDRNKRQVYQ